LTVYEKKPSKDVKLNVAINISTYEEEGEKNANLYFCILTLSSNWKSFNGLVDGLGRHSSSALEIGLIS